MTTEADQASAASDALADGRVVVLPFGRGVEPVEVPPGVRRRMTLSDVLLYREVDQARRLKAVAELAAEAQELGAY